MTALDHAQAVDFRALFDAHAGYVWASLRRLGVDTNDLEDLTHDVFFQVHRRMLDYDATRLVRPWLFGFVFRIASQHRRLAKHRFEVPLDDPTRVVSTTPPADESLAREEDRQLVLEALSALDLDKRAVLVMSDIDEVTMPDIAAALEIPLNTGYSRLRLARGEFAAAVKRSRSRRGDR